MIVVAIAVVLALFAYNKFAPVPVDASGNPIVTNIDQYSETLDRAEKLSEQHLLDADQGKEMTDSAVKDLQKAAGMFDSLANFQTTNIAPYLGAGKCYQVLGNDDAAVKRFQQGLATVPPDPIAAVLDTEIETYYLLSKSLFNLKDYAGSLKAVNSAIKLFPRSPIYLSQRARIYIQQHQYVEAARDLNDSIQIDPSYKLAQGLLKLIGISASDAYAESAKKKLNEQDYKGVVADCDEGLRIAFGYPPLLILRAAANFKLGNKPEAKKDVDAVLRLHPDNKDALALRNLMK